MTGLLSLIINPIVWAVNSVSQTTTSGEITESGTIGIIVIAGIIGPVVLLIIAAIISKPRMFRIPGLFVGSVILLISVMIVFFAAASFLLGFIVPQ